MAVILDKPLVWMPARRNPLPLLLAGLLCVFAGFSLMGYPKHAVGFLVLGGVFALVGALALVAAIFRLLNEKPALRLSPEGVYDNTRLVSIGWARLGDVVGLRTEGPPDAPTRVSILLRHPEKYVYAAPVPFQRALKKRWQTHGSPVVVDAARVKGSLFPLVEQLTWRLEARARGEG